MTLPNGVKPLRDWQKERVYDAEDDGEKGRPFESLAAVQRYCTEVMAKDWLVRPHPLLDLAEIEVHDGRGSRRARTVGAFALHVPRWARHEQIVLHELAHLIMVRRRWSRFCASHGQEFVQVFLHLIGAQNGFGARQEMAARFRRRRVVWSGSDLQRWPADMADRWVEWCRREGIELPPEFMLAQRRVEVRLAAKEEALFAASLEATRGETW